MRNRLHEIIPDSTPIPLVDIVIEPTLTGRSLELVQRAGLAGRRLMVVCDANTHAALANRLAHELGLPATELLVLPAPHADHATVDHINAHQYEALIAVGSGTLNDLCKYAAFLQQKPYIVFPTAPSMNGYISANASITSANGLKTSQKAQLPKAVFCDLGVIANAPLRLIQSGLGDSLCRPTAQADWLLSHLLLGTAYDPLPFTFLEPYEDDLLNTAGALAQRKAYAIELLMRTLLASGLGMVAAGGSYPASQGEHLIAHAMELKHGHTLPASYHGEQIGVATLIMADLQERLLKRPLRLRKHTDWLQTAVAFFGEGARDEIMQAGKGKFELIARRMDEINENLAMEASHLRDSITKVMRPRQQLQKALEAAGAPITPAALGWSDDDVQQALHHACYLRDRFTFLDLV